VVNLMTQDGTTDATGKPIATFVKILCFVRMVALHGVYAGATAFTPQADGQLLPSAGCNARR
jgi:hypothetical protein